VVFQWAMALIPLAAGCGWYFRGKDNLVNTKQLKQPTREYYFRGLNHIINEEADKAVDAFVKLIEVDVDTVETHLALGNLFRRRGEVDRAIRIHQNIIVRSGITDDLRLLAYTALANDYLHAGVLDRAEQVSLHLIKIGAESYEILNNLLKVYQKERKWDKAIQIAKKIEKFSSNSYSVEIAHYYSELADNMFHLGQYDKMQVYLKQALSFDAGSVRVHLLLIRIHINHKQYKKALNRCKNIEKKSVSLLSYVIPDLLECILLMDLDVRERLEAYINEVISQYPFLFFVLTVDERFDLNILKSGTFDVVFSHLKNQSSLERIHYFLCFQQMNAVGDARLQAMHLRNYLNTMITDNLVHQCSHCGFKINVVFWCCPGCDKWSTAIRRIFLLSGNEEKSERHE
jgi:lipopolysaccharide assembly protein B